MFHAKMFLVRRSVHTNPDEWQAWQRSRIAVWDAPEVLEHLGTDRIEDVNYEPTQQDEAISRLHKRDQARFEEAGLRAHTLERHTGRLVVRHSGRAFSGLHPIHSAEILDGLEFLADIMFYTSNAQFIGGADRISPFVGGKNHFVQCTRPNDWVIVAAARISGETHTATPSSSSTEVQAAPRLDSLETQHAEELAQAQQRVIDRADNI